MSQVENINVTQGAGVIMIMCLLVLGIVLFRQRLDLVMGLVLRFLCGIVGIYLINMVMEKISLNAVIGMNPATLLATTILGIPGLVMLYGIKIVSIL